MGSATGAGEEGGMRDSPAVGSQGLPDAMSGTNGDGNAAVAEHGVDEKVKGAVKTETSAKDAEEDVKMEG